jgi:hypothetical protein
LNNLTLLLLSLVPFPKPCHSKLGYFDYEVVMSS